MKRVAGEHSWPKAKEVRGTEAPPVCSLPHFTGALRESVSTVVEEVCACLLCSIKRAQSVIHPSCKSLKMIYFAPVLCHYSFTTKHDFMSLSSFKDLSICVSPKIIKAFKPYYLTHSQID